MGTAVQVTLTPADVAFALSIATQRVANKTGGQRFVADGLTPLGYHLVGVLGELGASKMLGCEINQSILRHGDRGAPDLKCSLGDVEVKTSTWRGDDVMLKLQPSEMRDGLLYVLVVVTMPDICLVYPPIYNSTFKEVGRVKDFGHGWRMVMTGKQIEQHAMDF